MFLVGKEGKSKKEGWEERREGDRRRGRQASDLPMCREGRQQWHECLGVQ